MEKWEIFNGNFQNYKSRHLPKAQKEAYFRLKTQPAEYAIKAQKVESATTAKKICESWALNIA